MKKIGYMFLVSFCLFGCTVQPLTKHESLKIIVASDLHYFAKDYYKDCEWFEESMLYGDGKMVTYADEILDSFVETVKNEKPDLVILTGDLSFNGEKGSHQGLATKLQVIQKSGINVAVLPGNHDIDNYNAKGYGKDDYFEVEKVNAESFREIYKQLGYEISVSQHDKSLSYRIDLNDRYSLLMMDSTSHQLTTGTSLDMGGSFTDSTISWLKQELMDIEKSKKIPLVAMHHNLTNHNELLNSGYTIKEHQVIADLFETYHTPFVLSGHIHCQNIKKINSIYDIASSSLLDAPLQYGIINLDNDSMTYRTNSLKISKDANAYFNEVSSNRFKESFQSIQDKKIREEMMDVIVKTNLYYFTGNLSEHIDEIKEMKGYGYYYQKEGKLLDFHKQYLESMLKDKDDNQNLTLSF